MFDLLRAIAIVLAIVASARARSALGVACACALAYATAADLSSLVAAAERAPPSIDAAWAAIFLGPSGLPGRGAGALFLSGVIGAHPFVVRIATALGASSMFMRAHRRSSRLRPESLEARRVDAMARPFLGIALLDVAQLVLAGAARALLAGE